MGAHTDPGVLTLKRISDIAGVELDAAVAGSTRHGDGQRARTRTRTRSDPEPKPEPDP